jgi:DNA-binding NtrC family response regulator
MLHVLLVDDDPGQSRIREIILRGAGIAAILATDAEGALACLRSRRDEIGVVVTDHNLPGRSGADLVHELHLMAPTLPVVVLSGMQGIEPEYDGLDVTFCLKPLPAEEFIRIIERLLSE